MKTIFYTLLTILAFGCTNQDKKFPENFDFGKTENGLYKNSFFDMEVHFKKDWVVQDNQQVNSLVEKGSDVFAGDDKNMRAVVKASLVKTAYLLTIFKYEVGSAVEFNPSFMISAENIGNAPGIKKGSDYLFHVKKGLEQSQMEYYFDKDVYKKIIGDSEFYVLEARLDYMGKTIIQDYIATISNGFGLSFILSYTTDDEKNEIYEIVDNIKI